MNPLLHTLRCAALALLAVAAGASAHDYQAGAIRIDHPWARPTVPGQPAGGGFLVLRNESAAPDRLLSARSAAVERVELHLMKMEGDVMRMRQVEAIDLPAGATVKLEPGGLHLMLIGLKAPLKAGTRVPLMLRFEKAGEVAVEVAVEQPPAGQAPAHGGHGH
ncbi:MAG TPA: copper chaperone PCu(A)C [Methylibium sp.]|nr:copper chaperone PCu(A)C [Methylibium sp.]